MIDHPAPASNSGGSPWTSEIRRQAWIAVRLAATSTPRCPRTLAYYLRAAHAHGLTFDECCEAGNLSPVIVRRLLDPAVA